MIEKTIYLLTIWALPVLLAITFHEAAHAYAARLLGDDTAARLGRVSLNPLKHIDPFGTILLPGLLLLTQAPFLFGYAKPVPVNFNRLNNPRRDMVWVALAGPGINIAMALVAGLLAYLLPYLPASAAGWLADSLSVAIQINLVLALFNMIPLPPLDGGRVAVGLLPDSLALPLARLEPYGIAVLLLVLLVVPSLFGYFGLDVNPIAWILGPPLEFLYDLVLRVTGHGA